MNWVGGNLVKHKRRQPTARNAKAQERLRIEAYIRQRQAHEGRPLSAFGGLRNAADIRAKAAGRGNKAKQSANVSMVVRSFRGHEHSMIQQATTSSSVQQKPFDEFDLDKFVPKNYPPILEQYEQLYSGMFDLSNLVPKVTEDDEDSNDEENENNSDNDNDSMFDVERGEQQSESVLRSSISSSLSVKHFGEFDVDQDKTFGTRNNNFSPIQPEFQQDQYQYHQHMYEDEEDDNSGDSGDASMFTELEQSFRSRFNDEVFDQDEEFGAQNFSPILEQQHQQQYEYSGMMMPCKVTDDHDDDEHDENSDYASMLVELEQSVRSSISSSVSSISKRKSQQRPSFNYNANNANNAFNNNIHSSSRSSLSLAKHFEEFDDHENEEFVPKNNNFSPTLEHQQYEQPFYDVDDDPGDVSMLVQLEQSIRSRIASSTVRKSQQRPSFIYNNNKNANANNTFNNNIHSSSRSSLSAKHFDEIDQEEFGPKNNFSHTLEQQNYEQLQLYSGKMPKMTTNIGHHCNGDQDNNNSDEEDYASISLKQLEQSVRSRIPATERKSQRPSFNYHNFNALHNNIINQGATSFSANNHQSHEEEEETVVFEADHLAVLYRSDESQASKSNLTYETDY